MNVLLPDLYMYVLLPDLYEVTVTKQREKMCVIHFLYLLFLFPFQSQYKFVCEAILRVYNGECGARMADDSGHLLVLRTCCVNSFPPLIHK